MVRVSRRVGRGGLGPVWGPVLGTFLEKKVGTVFALVEASANPYSALRGTDMKGWGRRPPATSKAGAFGQLTGSLCND